MRLEGAPARAGASAAMGASAAGRARAAVGRAVRAVRRELRGGNGARVVAGVLAAAAAAAAAWAVATVVLAAHGRRRIAAEETPLRQVEAMQRAWAGVMGGAAVGGGAWEEVMRDVAIAVKTGTEVSGERLRVLKEDGWMSVGRQVPNLLVIGEEQAPGVVGMKRYGTELLMDEERHVAEAGGHAGGQDGVDGGGGDWNATAGAVDGDALAGAGMLRGGAAPERPRKWFVKSGWRGDKDKNLPALHLLRTVYPGKKWYVLLDDDTYVFLDTLAAFVRRHEPDVSAGTPVYTGKIFFVAGCGAWSKSGKPKSGDGPKAGFAHGGSGIVMNGAAMDRLYPATAGCMRTYSSCWAGDMQVALCLRGAGVEPVRYGKARVFEHHFHQFAPSRAMADTRYIKRWLSAESPMSYHKMAREEANALSRFERDALRAGKPVRYAQLLEALMGAGVMPTYSKKEPDHVSHALDRTHEDFIGLGEIEQAAKAAAEATTSAH